MATVTLRSVKGSALTHTEMDDNINNLNTDKLENGGDTITGSLTFNTGGNTDTAFDEDGVDRSSGSAETFNFQNSGAGSMELQVSSSEVWHAGNDGSGSGLDADTVDGNEAAALLARANHTGTQTLATISDSGALAALDAVNQSTIDNSSIGQGELKSATATQSLQVLSGNYGEISLSGGSYTLFWTLGTDALAPNTQDGDDGFIGPVHNDAGYSSKVGYYVHGSPAKFGYLYSRYVQASPPWVHGQTEVPIYIMAMLDKNTKEVLGTYVAQDPPWAYHGPHNLHPVDGRLDKAFGFWGKSLSERRQDPEFINKLREMKRLKQQGGKELSDLLKANTFSMDEKMIDMDAVPHLLYGFDPAKHVIVMLDPDCPCTEEHALLQEFAPEMGDEHISKLLHKGRVRIDNIPMDFPGPKSVLTCKYKVK